MRTTSGSNNLFTLYPSAFVSYSSALDAAITGGTHPAVRSLQKN